MNLLLLGLAEEGSLLILGGDCKLSEIIQGEMKPKIDRIEKICSESNY